MSLVVKEGGELTLLTPVALATFFGMSQPAAAGHPAEALRPERLVAVSVLGALGVAQVRPGGRRRRGHRGEGRLFVHGTVDRRLRAGIVCVKLAEARGHPLLAGASAKGASRDVGDAVAAVLSKVGAAGIHAVVCKTSMLE